MSESKVVSLLTKRQEKEASCITLEGLHDAKEAVICLLQENIGLGEDKTIHTQKEMFNQLIKVLSDQGITEEEDLQVLLGGLVAGIWSFAANSWGVSYTKGFLEEIIQFICAEP